MILYGNGVYCWEVRWPKSLNSSTREEEVYAFLYDTSWHVLVQDKWDIWEFTIHTNGTATWGRYAITNIVKFDTLITFPT